MEAIPNLPKVKNTNSYELQNISSIKDSDPRDLRILKNNLCDIDAEIRRPHDTAHTRLLPEEEHGVHRNPKPTDNMLVAVRKSINNILPIIELVIVGQAINKIPAIILFLAQIPTVLAQTTEMKATR